MSSIADRLQTAFDRWATDVAIKRQTLRRRHPDLADEQIEQLLNQWLAERPGATHGDGPQRSGA